MDIKPYAEKAVELLKKRKMKVSFAESCTGGMIAEAITSVSGASCVFECGIVSYADKIKHKILFVPEDVLAKYHAVSGIVAGYMAKGALIQGESDVAVSVTGIAGPLSDESGIEVGTVYLGLYDKNGLVRVFNPNPCIPADCPKENIREYIRNFAAQKAFEYLCGYLEEYPDEKNMEEFSDFLLKYK